MGRKKYQRYGEEFKREALMLLESSGKSVAEIEEDLGLTKGILYKWKYRYQVVEDKRGKKKVAPSELAEVQAEVRRLRRELETVRQEREILKKAAIFFASQKE